MTTTIAPPPESAAARCFQLTAPNAPDTPQLARDHVAYLLLRARLPELAETARLLVSEVVTNVVVHTNVPILVVETTIRPGRVVVAVQDTSPRRIPALRPAVHPDEERGRGLQLVQLLSTAWGIDFHGAPKPLTKTIWFELREPLLAA